MNILVIDSDLAIQEYYKNLLESEFRSVAVKFETSAPKALELLKANHYDLVMTETHQEGVGFFDFLESIIKLKIPVIVVSSHSSERFIVECMRAGAMDFISKKNIKLGHLPRIITRTLLEADRWKAIVAHSETLSYRPEYLKINENIRSFLKDEQDEYKRSMISRGLVANKDQVFKEGETYFIIYLYLHLYFPPNVMNNTAPERISKIRSQVMNRITEIPGRYGGNIWTLKEDGCFVAFVGDSYVSALLSAIEMHGSMNVLNVSIDNLLEPLTVSIGLAAGRTIYRENKGDIYSEALNLSAHMAFHKPEENNILLTSDIYDNLWPRAKKYLFHTDPFEGHVTYRYEPIA